MEEVSAWARWDWDCPCGYTNTEDHDPTGEDVTCDECGLVCRVTHAH